MQFIRQQMRSQRGRELTVPQLRTIYFVGRAPGSSLSDVADYIGLSLPAMSRLVDGLVKQSLMSRQACKDDRRHVRLSVTARGEAALASAWNATHVELAKAVSHLSAEQMETISRAMDSLRATFDPDAIRES